MTSDDKDLPETLDLLAKLVASISDRLDQQTALLAELAQAQADALERLAAAQAQTQARPAAIDLGRVSQVTDHAVRDALKPTLTKLVDILETMTGTKAVLRERLRAIDREEARQGRWRFLPLGVTVGIPLLLVTVLALTVPRAAAQFSPTCRITGGEWYDATETYTAACMYPKEGQGAAAGS